MNKLKLWLIKKLGGEVKKYDIQVFSKEVTLTKWLYKDNENTKAERQFVLEELQRDLFMSLVEKGLPQFETFQYKTGLQTFRATIKVAVPLKH